MATCIPFESDLVRALIIVILFLIVGGLILWRILARRSAEKKIESAIAEPQAVGVQDDSPVLNEKMRDALATLKTAKLSSANALYDLPWYLIIGPPGAGKTTALVNSGLKFPLAGEGAVKAVQGRRRHALLRLVVHRPGRADRHRRPLHDAGFRRQGRPAELARRS